MKLAGWSLGSGFGVNLIFSSNHEFWVASVPFVVVVVVLGPLSMLVGMLLLVLGFSVLHVAGWYLMLLLLAIAGRAIRCLAGGW